MDTEELLKYLGCAVLLIVLIYIIVVVLRVNNDFIGSVLGGKFREGLTNNEAEEATKKKEKIDKALKSAKNTLVMVKAFGGDYSGSEDEVSELLTTWKEITMRGALANLLRIDNWTKADKVFKEDLKPEEKVSLLTLFNELQEFVDGS